MAITRMRFLQGGELGRAALRCSLCAACAPPSSRDSTLVAWDRSLTHLAREGRMTVTIGRRELLAALGGAVAWPFAARAQQSAKTRVGITSIQPRTSPIYAAFDRRLRELG